MRYPLLIGNIAGYLVACAFYGQLLPVLTAPAIVGALIGGVVAVVGGLIISDFSADGDRSMTKEEWKKKHREERMRKGSDS